MDEDSRQSFDSGRAVSQASSPIQQQAPMQAQAQSQTPEQASGPNRSWVIIVVLLVLAAVCASVTVALVVGRSPARYEIVASVKAAGLNGEGTRIPVRVTGTDTHGTQVAEDVWLAHDGTGLSLPAGSFDVALQGSPISSAGDLYYVDDIVLSLQVPEVGNSNVALTVPTDQVIELRQKPAEEVTDTDIANAAAWAKKDPSNVAFGGEQGVVALVDKATAKRDEAVEAKRQADNEAAKQAAEQEARDKAEAEAKAAEEQRQAKVSDAQNRGLTVLEGTVHVWTFAEVGEYEGHSDLAGVMGRNPDTDTAAIIVLDSPTVVTYGGLGNSVGQAQETHLTIAVDEDVINYRWPYAGAVDEWRAYDGAHACLAGNPIEPGGEAFPVCLMLQDAEVLYAD